LTETLETMRAMLGANRPRSWNLGYPPAVRAKVRAWVARRRAEGMTPTAIAAELGLSRHSVLSWAKRDEVPRSLIPVEVLAETDAQAPSAGAVLVSPRGYRVEGLDVGAIGALLERLG
jgi:DNA invertase Pin-like site-specific DNA recombinase